MTRCGPSDFRNIDPHKTASSLIEGRAALAVRNFPMILSSAYVAGARWNLGRRDAGPGLAPHAPPTCRVRRAQARHKPIQSGGRTVVAPSPGRRNGLGRRPTSGRPCSPLPDLTVNGITRYFCQSVDTVTIHGPDGKAVPSLRRRGQANRDVYVGRCHHGASMSAVALHRSLTGSTPGSHAQWQAKAVLISEDKLRCNPCVVDMGHRHIYFLIGTGPARSRLLAVGDHWPVIHSRDSTRRPALIPHVSSKVVR